MDSSVSQRVSLSRHGTRLHRRLNLERLEPRTMLAALSLLSSESTVESCFAGQCTTRSQANTPPSGESIASATLDLTTSRTTASAGVFGSNPSSWLSQGESRVLDNGPAGETASLATSVRTRYRIVPQVGSEEEGDGVVFVLSGGVRVQAWGYAEPAENPADGWLHHSVKASGSMLVNYTISSGPSDQFASPLVSAESTRPSPGAAETVWPLDRVINGRVGDEVQFAMAGAWNAVFGSTSALFPQGTEPADTTSKATAFHGVTLTVSRPAELKALSLAWPSAGESIAYSFEYSRGDAVPLPSQSTVAFYWASGPTWQDRLGGPAHQQQAATQLPQGTWTATAAANLNPALLSARPQGATHLLMVLDPADSIFEWKEGNNLLAVAAPATGAVCQVPPLSIADAGLPQPQPRNLTPALLAAVDALEALILAEPGSPTFALTLGHIPQSLEQHLFEIHTRYKELATLPGVEAFMLEGADAGSVLDERPQLRLAANPSAEAAACQARIDEINAEVVNHDLFPDAVGRPAAYPPGSSLHGRLPAEAVDVAITGLADSRIDALADQAGLKRPFRSDGTHYQLKSDTTRPLAAVVRGEGPLHLLLEDPQGRKIGYDPATQQAINQIGVHAEHFGGGTQPSLILLPLGDVLSGQYRISGQGAGSGSYRITVQVYGDDLGKALFEMAVGSGTASAGAALATIAPIDLAAAAAAPWRNPLLPLDVSADGFITPLDALLIINALNRDGAHAIPYGTPRTAFLDPSGDNFVVPLDALLVINRLNAIAAGQGEGEQGEGERDAGEQGETAFGAATLAADSRVADTKLRLDSSWALSLARAADADQRARTRRG